MSDETKPTPSEAWLAYTQARDNGDKALADKRWLEYIEAIYDEQNRKAA